jgi:hypothetical protein
MELSGKISFLILYKIVVRKYEKNESKNKASTGKYNWLM